VIAVVCLAGEASQAAFPLVLGADLVVAADAGARFAIVAGRTPDVVVGDFDSLSEEELVHIEKAGAEVVRFPGAKDETDAELAVREALARGADEVVLVGATGDRLDHVLGSLAVLAEADRAGARAWAFDGVTEVHVLSTMGRTRSLDLEDAQGATLSIVPFVCDSAVVSAQGVRWLLVRERLEGAATRGVSNEVSAARARIEVHEGTILVLVTRAV
jgi:thiamine pyrophosphokinase